MYPGAIYFQGQVFQQQSWGSHSRSFETESLGCRDRKWAFSECTTPDSVDLKGCCLLPTPGKQSNSLQWGFQASPQSERGVILFLTDTHKNTEAREVTGPELTLKMVCEDYRSHIPANRVSCFQLSCDLKHCLICTMG